MKKITSLLIVAVMLLSLWSCTAEPTPAASADSSSGEFVLTKDMISDMLKETKDEATSPEGNLPVFMSLEKVKECIKKQDFSYKEQLGKYEETVNVKLESLISKLPERCVIEGITFWNRNTDSEVTRYVVLDPQNVPEEDAWEFGSYLEWKYLETRYTEVKDERNYGQYYDFDMKALDEKYSDIIGTVLVERRYGGWFYLDTAEDTLVCLDFFPDHNAIKNEIYRPFTEQVEEFTAMLNEAKNN